MFAARRVSRSLVSSARPSSVVSFGTRNFYEQNQTKRSSVVPSFVNEYSSSDSTYVNKNMLWGVIGAGVAAWTLSKSYEARESVPDFKQIRKEIEDILDDENYDDGSYGPVLVRLAWHSSGTYSADEQNGGSDGANIRHLPESGHGANAGLDVARARLEAIKKRHPAISYADLFVFASIVAIEAMGGPVISFSPGRTDTPEDGNDGTPDGRLPDASQGQAHIRDVFGRMGFSDEEMVALIGGGHAIGRCHTDRSGFEGPWTNSPTMFTNDYFVQLLNNKWTVRKWDGPKQFQDPTGALMMLPADMELKSDPAFRKYSERFAADEEYFFAVFAKAYGKLTSLGCNNLCPRAI